MPRRDAVEPLQEPTGGPERTGEPRSGPAPPHREGSAAPGGAESRPADPPYPSDRARARRPRGTPPSILNRALPGREIPSMARTRAKISIIGAGNVGATCAHWAAAKELGWEVSVIDAAGSFISSAL